MMAFRVDVVSVVVTVVVGVLLLSFVVGVAIQRRTGVAPGSLPASGRCQI